MLHPGEVRSKYDGEKHFIGAEELKHLYHVLPSDEVYINNPNQNKFTENYCKARGLLFLHLYPSYEGDYYDIHQHDDFEPIRNL